MPFSSNPLLAPVFQSPVGDGRDHMPPVVSIKRAEDAIESGIRLHHNQAREGFILQPEVEGLGVAPVELQTAPLASGGSVARHARLVEGDVFLPITLVSPVPSALPSMFDALVDVARPGQRGEDGLPLQFEVVVYDPYGQETRSRRLIFESGLGDPVRVNHHIWRTSITGRFVDPFWYGVVRELRRTLGSVDKKFITAKQGPPDPDSPPAVTYEWEGEPHASPSVMKRDSEVVATNRFIDPRFTDESNFTLHNELLTTHVFRAMDGYGLELRANSGDANSRPRALLNLETQPPGEWALSIDAQRVANGGDMRFIFFGAPGVSTTVFAPSSTVWERHTVTASVPHEWDSLYLEFNGFGPEDPGTVYGRFDGAVLALGETQQEALDQVAEYFDGDTPDVPSRQIGGYEFSFFPVRIGGSVVQGEYELQVEGDAPAYWSGVITPPGEDLLIQNAQGERIFVQGRVDEPILIQTRPQEQDITLADGTPIWDRIDPGDDEFFPLHPGRNTVHVSMVGSTQQSEILIRYREAFFHSLGGGQ